jgi:hypothetical protein
MTTTITEEPIAPIIDAEAAQNAARADPDVVKMIYNKDIEQSGSSIWITAFSGYDASAIQIGIRVRHGSTTHHLSIEEAKAMRDALTEAIAAREKVTGAL